MVQAIFTWKEKEWEKHVKALARLRHGPGNFCDVPDAHGGDFGIEGYSFDGFAYQAYSPREPLTTVQLYERHRAKITADLKKFVNNSENLQRLFGAVVIQRWILVVPRQESAKLVQFATEKSVHIRGLSLPYIAPDFEVMIQTEEDFPEEKQRLLRIGLSEFNIVTPLVTPEDISDWADENDNLIRTLDEKTAQLDSTASETNRRKLRDELIRLYIIGRNVLAKLRDDYPEFWEVANNCKTDREEELVLYYQLSEESPKQSIRQEIELMKGAFASKVPGIDERTATNLAHEAISDWMIRCPLNFDS